MLEKWGFDYNSRVSLFAWAAPWAIIGMILGFIVLFTVPSAPLWAFGIGFVLMVTERALEVYIEGKL